jgi:hypothetical protein
MILNFLVNALKLVSRPISLFLAVTALTMAIAASIQVVLWINQTFFSVSDLQYRDNLPAFESSDAQGPQAGREALIRLTNSKGQHICSAFVVSNRYAITAAHCLDEASGILTRKKFKVFDIERKDTGIEVEAVGLVNRMDMGLVMGDFSGFKKLSLDSPPKGFLGRESSVFAACGFPMGDKELCIPQLVGPNIYFMVQVDRPVYPGMSGGPVIDLKDGTVVGIISSTERGGSLMAPIVSIWSAFGIEQK